MAGRIAEKWSKSGMREGQVVIVGANEAGTAAAAALRESGFTGRVVLLSDERQAPYERPPLSKEMLLGELTDTKLIRPAEWYEDEGIDLRLGCRAVGVDAGEQSVVVRSADGAEEKLHYDKLLLTTGARARELPGAGDDVLYLRTYEDSMRLREAMERGARIAVIGGGVIGLEVASSARALGNEVTVVDVAPRLMARALAPDISVLLRQLHEEAGVHIFTDVKSVDIEADAEGGKRLRLGTGESVVADVVVAGIGVVPNTELGQMAGCHTDNGIVVDGCGRTSVENIYAAGDVASFHHPTFARPMRVEAWQHAGRHGAHVAHAMMNVRDDYCEVPWFWTDQHMTNVQVAGLAADCDATFWRGEGEKRTAFHFSQGELVAVTTINNGRDIRPSTKLLAARWKGDPAGLLDLSRPLGKLVTSLLADPVG